MKDLLANILAALLAGAFGIGYVIAGLAVYAFTMFWWGVSFEAAIALPFVIVLMFAVFIGFMWLSERIHYIWLFPLYAMVLAAAGAVALYLKAGDDATISAAYFNRPPFSEGYRTPS